MRLFLSVLMAGLVATGLAQSSTAPAGVVSGIVADTSGAAVPGAVVELMDGRRLVARDTANERGAFRFEVVAAGTYQVRASAPGLAAASVAITVTGTPSPPLRLVLASLRQDLAATAKAEPPPPQAPSSSPAAAPPPTMAEQAARVLRRAGQNNVMMDGISARDRTGRMAVAAAEWNTEAYAKIDDNGFHLVADDPLSTFSIDVDTASYANVRRFLNDGVLPPADAVRLEELINYFRFDYAAPSGDRPFGITTEVGPAPWAPSHRLVLVGLEAEPVPQDRIPPRNLVFLLDVSGSMNSPDKLPLVKTAMRMLTATLTPADHVAIVVYAGASGVALPSTSGADKARIDQAIAELQSSGSTNGAAGIELAYDIATRSFIRNGINRVILATDGDFNVGVTSEGELMRLIEDKRERGVFLSVLGVGTGNIKDSTMEQLADRGNGNYAYLDSLHEARRVLIAEAGATLMTVAKDVKIQVEFNPARVGAYRLVGYENRMLANRDFNDDTKDAGEIGAGHTVTALYEIVPPGQPVAAADVDPLKYQVAPRTAPAATSDELLTVKLRYKEPQGDTSRLMTVPVRDRDGRLTPNLGFAAAVAEFGMLLRGSEHAGASTWTNARELGVRFRGEDADGYRAEFIRLVDLASALEGQRATSSQRYR